MFGRVIRLAPGAAFQISIGNLRCLHCVAVTQRTHRESFINPAQPSRKKLRAFVDFAVEASKDHAPELLVTSPQRRTNPGWRYDALDAEVIIDWLEATKYIRSIRESREATDAWAKVFARPSGISAARLSADVEKVHPEALRRSRVRLDCVAMVLFRRFWQVQVQALPDNLPHIYMFADASPQWRGLELYASSFDMVLGESLSHRLFPLVSLDKEYLDAPGK